MIESPFHNGSFWFDSLPDADWQNPEARDLPERVDVAVVGGGFTGLWSAYYLRKLAPALTVAVFEADVCGFGASGRNGGWCMAAASGVMDMLADPDRRDRGIALQRALFDTLDEIERVLAAEQIDCHFHRGGWLQVASHARAAERGRETVDRLHGCGFGELDFRWLESEEAQHRLHAEPNHGAVYASHVAAVHPGRLVRGLKAAVEQAGVVVLERTPVLGYEPGEVMTTRGPVRAETILRATEGYTDSIAGQRRSLAQLYSTVVATEPMPLALWDEIGLQNRETFDDSRRVTIYGQRTQDDRLVFGGRAFYLYAGRRLRRLPAAHRSIGHVTAALRELLPATRDVPISHAWGGFMGLPRHLRPCVSFARASRTGWAGGYTGEGVGASNLAARILVDLALERSSPLTQLAWVDDVPRRWEPEPVRWLGIRGVEGLGRLADRLERSRGAPSRPGQLFDRLLH